MGHVSLGDLSKGFLALVNQQSQVNNLWLKLTDRIGPSHLSIFEWILIGGMTFLGLCFLIGVMVYNYRVYREKLKAGQMKSMVQRVADNRGLLYEAEPYSSEDFARLAFVFQELNHGYFEDFFTYYLYKWSILGFIHIHGKKRNGLGETYRSGVEVFNHQQARVDSISFQQVVKEVEDKNCSVNFEAAMWAMLLDTIDDKGYVTDDQIREWAVDHSKATQRLARYLLNYSKHYLSSEGYFNFKSLTIWRTKNQVVEATEKGEKLLDRLVQYHNYLSSNDLIYFQFDDQAIGFEQALHWKILLEPSERVLKQLKALDPNILKTYETSDFDQYYEEYYKAFEFRVAWTNGLTRGGFSSPAAGSALGGGGPTGLGIGVKRKTS